MPSELQLTLAAAAFEVAVPVAALGVALYVSSLRKHALVVLGALTPAIVLLKWISISHALNPSDSSSTWAFRAVWVMGFFAYVALLLGGTLLSFLPRPRNAHARFFLGCASAPLSYAALVVIL